MSTETTNRDGGGQQLIVTAKTDGPQNAAFVQLASDSGARKMELHGLSWEHLDFDSGVLTIARIE